MPQENGLETFSTITLGTSSVHPLKISSAIPWNSILNSLGNSFDDFSNQFYKKLCCTVGIVRLFLKKLQKQFFEEFLLKLLRYIRYENFFENLFVNICGSFNEHFSSNSFGIYFSNIFWNLIWPIFKKAFNIFSRFPFKSLRNFQGSPYLNLSGNIFRCCSSSFPRTSSSFSLRI